MDVNGSTDELNEAIRRCRAGLKALETALEDVERGERLYPTHAHLATVELAAAIESVMKGLLRQG
ncbi:MAG: hypothetical protein ACRDFS_10425 [Chloroflexota bacterium]